MKVTVTGANGYLASNLVAKLAREGNDIAAVVNRNSDRVDALKRKHPGLITTYHSSELSEAVLDAKVIYHLAGVFTVSCETDQVRKMIESNLMLTLDLYDAAERFAPDAHVVLASSFSQLDSDGVNRESTYYSGMKALVELGTPALENRLAFLRVSDTFGPGDTRTKVHNLCASKMLAGEVFEFRSPGSTELALAHVDDVAEAFMFLGTSRIAGRFNLLNEELRITLAEVASLLQSGGEGSVTFPREDSFPVEIPFGVDLIPFWTPTRTPQAHLHDALILGRTQ